MNKSTFSDIPAQYTLLRNEICNNAISNIYCQFNFRYYFGKDENDQPFEFLFSYLKSFKFITFHFSDKPSVFQTSGGFNSKNYFVNIIICVEGECLIVEHVAYEPIVKLIKQLKEINISIINVSTINFKLEQEQNEKERELFEEGAKEEIKSFCLHFSQEIKKNEFVRYTIYSIIGFIIRRHFYPTDYFKDKSFFNFNCTKDTKENDMKSILTNFFSFENKEKIDQLKIESTDQIKIQNFQKTDFVNLRSFYSNSMASFKLVIHLESLNIFMIKEFFVCEENRKEIDREIYFCEHYSHRCLTHFYGFLIDDGEKVGLVYDYMSNGSLVSYLKVHKKFNSLFGLMTINRIFQGIEYLHKNHLIHRDLKPFNILLDHDNIPYISDFETIRHPITTDDEFQSEMTNNIGSGIYISPEQYGIIKGELVSYPTDIYSFGLIINFILEGKDKKFEELEKVEKSKPFYDLIKCCTKHFPSERPSCEEINDILINEMKSTSFAELENSMLKTNDIVNFLFEDFMIEGSIINIFNFHDLFLLRENKSLFYLKLGNIYFNGYGVKQDFLKARIYYQKSAEFDNLDALFNLGFIYENGHGVNINYLKAREYYKLSKNSYYLYFAGSMFLYGDFCKLDHDESLKCFEQFLEQEDINKLFSGLADIPRSNSKEYYRITCYYESLSEQIKTDIYRNLGDLYEKKHEYSKAKNFYELAACRHDNASICLLGTLYYNGYGVKQDFIKARECYELAAQKEDSNSYNNLGTICLNGQGVKQDFFKAKKYYELAARFCHSTAILNIGYMYEKGLGVKQDFLKAKEFYEKSSKFKNSNAFYNLGYLYENGFGVKQDYYKAKEYYEISSKQNNANALLNLANMYMNGRAVNQDIGIAEKLYELAAKQNNSNALCNLGNLYIHGLGVGRSVTKGFEYFERAAKLNNPNALKFLGLNYFNGQLVEKNFTKSCEYFERLVKITDDEKALLTLGMFYEIGLGVQINYSKAFQYYQRAEKLGSKEAFCSLGNLYHEGHGVKQNYFIAKQYYEKAARIGNDYANYCLGVYYYNGFGVQKDYLKAKKYFESCDLSNNQNALYNLGVIYHRGHGVKQDYSKAIYYYDKAAKFNDSGALFNLGCLYYSGHGSPIDLPRAKYYFQLSANSNNSYAMFMLGYLYYFGYGVKQDDSEAKKYFIESAKLNNPHSLLFLGHINRHKKDYIEARKYYEMSSKLYNSEAFLFLGLFYKYGLGVQVDDMKALGYFELSARYNNAYALYILARFYSFGETFDAFKSIHYYLKCIEIDYENVRFYEIKNHSETNIKKRNNFRYISCNDLGLIYLFELNDIEKAEKYLKEAGLNEYPFGQYNLGLFFKFYLNHIGNAEHMFKRSAENRFPLAEFMLGYMKEKEGSIEEAIQYYIKASDHEEEDLIFRSINYLNLLLGLSKIFIISVTNLKLSSFYFSSSDFIKAKEYFIKAFSNIQQNRFVYNVYQFYFPSNKTRNIIEYILSFILSAPLFNLANQLSLLENLFFDVNEIFDYDGNFIFNDVGVLFDFIVSKEDMRNNFVIEIQLVIQVLIDVLFTPPYPILFGRLSIMKKKHIDYFSPFLKNINDTFYEGFEIE
ncbi:hypothetical protein M9Y10_026859 [Tritrichomonas musculus]|uniref:Protein kinase domain-containing protein n=1 Tax=Tritrichomonas musculus TaxID=1915356 RepID=A0ABR2H8K8_9EUKA